MQTATTKQCKINSKISQYYTNKFTVVWQHTAQYAN